MSVRAEGKPAVNEPQIPHAVLGFFATTRLIFIKIKYLFTRRWTAGTEKIKYKVCWGSRFLESSMKAEHDDSTGERSLRAPGLICERCGRPDAIDIGGRQLCEECYQVAGSCCLEFGGDDLWQEDSG
jgi:hypothetical protein